MQAEVLLPSVVGLSGNVETSKTVNPGKNSNSGEGFSISLQAANQTSDKSHGKMPGVMLLEAVECISLDEMPYVMLPNAIPLNVLSNADTGALLFGTGECEVTQLQSILDVPASTEASPAGENRPGLVGLATNSPPTQTAMPSGMIAEKTGGNAELITAPVNTTLVNENGTEENTRNLINSNNQQAAANQTAQKSYMTTRAATLTGSEQTGHGENQSVTSPQGGSDQSNRVWHGDVTNPRQLITVESERLHGVKTQLPTSTEVIVEASPGAVDSIHTETVLVEKNTIPHKVVSTQDIIEQIVNKIEVFSNPKSNVVTIKLEPEFLGRLQINLEVVDDVLIARFSTDNLQVKQLLENGLTQLRSQLETSGIRLDRAEVNIDLGHQFGGYQHQNESGYQNRQSIPYEMTTYYPESAVGDNSTMETGEDRMPPTEYTDGSINYLI